MTEENLLYGLVQSFYDAAAGQSDFGLLAPQVAHAFNASSCAIQIRGGFASAAEIASATANYTPELVQQYQEYYYKVDVWANVAMRWPQEAILGSEDMISDEEYERTELYNDYSRYAGIFYVLGAVTKIGGPGGALGAFGIHRSRREGLFSPEEKQRAAILLPHLNRALQLRERLGRMDISQQTMMQALEMAGVAILLSANDGRLAVWDRGAVRGNFCTRAGDGISGLAAWADP